MSIKRLRRVLLNLPQLVEASITQQLRVLRHKMLYNSASHSSVRAVRTYTTTALASASEVSARKEHPTYLCFLPPGWLR